MKISLTITILILLAAGAVGLRDRDRLSTARALEKHLTSSKAPPISESPAGKSIDRAEADQRSSTELADWLKEFGKYQNGNPDELKQAVTKIMKRLESMEAHQAEFMVDEMLAGRGINGFPGPLVINHCFTKLSNEQPMKAIALFARYRDRWKDSQHVREIGGRIIGDSLIALAKDSPESAVKWLRVEEKNFREQIPDATKRAVLFTIAAEDPALAFQMTGELGFKADDEALGSIVRAARTDGDRKKMIAALRTHLGKMADATSRQNAAKTGFGAFASRLASEDIAVTERWITAAKLTPEETGDFVAGIIARKESDGMTAEWMDWLGQTVPPGTLDANVRKLFATWTETDYQAAGRWLTTASPGPFKDLSIRTYAETAAGYDPETAEKWAMTLPAGTVRDETLRNIGVNWPKNDPEDERTAAEFAKRHGID
ncbi:MAG: hypothetical protein V4584_02200 [Verrucomicrobiota bacterium]